MLPHIERMIDELRELNHRTNKLEIFVNSSAIYVHLPDEERALLRVQLNAMKIYSDTLTLRIRKAS